MATPASSGPMKLPVAIASPKLLKFLVRSSFVPMPPIMFCTDTL
jgi:hypothetical protein